MSEVQKTERMKMEIPSTRDFCCLHGEGCYNHPEDGPRGIETASPKDYMLEGALESCGLNIVRLQPSRARPAGELYCLNQIPQTVRERFDFVLAYRF